jgi:hypothetical protein
MHKAVTVLTAAALVIGLVVAACKKADDEQPPQYGQPPPYGQPAPGQQTPGQPMPQPQPTVAQPAPAGTLSQPGPAAPPCQTDANCFTARCNTAFGKCVFPCQNDNDCVAPNKCVMGTGLCVPALPGFGAGGAGH